MRRFDRYRFDSATRGHFDTFNEVHRDLDERLNVLEDGKADADAEVRRLKALGYEQVALILGEAVAGINSAPVEPDPSVMFAEGEVTLTMQVGSILNYLDPPPFIGLSRTGSPDDWCIAHTISFDRAARQLTVDIQTVGGAAGPWQDVVVTFVPGGLLAQVQYLTQSRAARDLARDWAEAADGADVTTAGTRSARHHAHAADASAEAAAGSATAAGGQVAVAEGHVATASGHAALAGASATAAGASATLAQQWASKAEDDIVAGGLYSSRHYAAKAAASAIAAATFDPAAHYTRTEVDDLVGDVVADAAAAIADGIGGAVASTTMLAMAMPTILTNYTRLHDGVVAAVLTCGASSATDEFSSAASTQVANIDSPARIRRSTWLGEVPAMAALTQGGYTASSSPVNATIYTVFDRTSSPTSLSLTSGQESWIKIDLGAAKAIGRAVYQIGGVGGQTIKLQYSTDDTAWSDAATLVFGGYQSTTLTPVTARYWRVWCNATTTGVLSWRGLQLIPAGYDFGATVAVSHPIASGYVPSHVAVSAYGVDGVGALAAGALKASVSRDGGTTFSAYVDMAALTAGVPTLVASPEIDVSGQPSGSSIVIRIKWESAVDAILSGVRVDWG